MEMPGEPAASLGQTLEWLREELVSLFFCLVMSPKYVFLRLLVTHTHTHTHTLPRTSLAEMGLQAEVWVLQTPYLDQPHRVQWNS
jgi:hypothetical protein